MTRKNPLFILDRFNCSISASSSSAWASRGAKNITPTAAGFSYPLVDGVEYLPIAFVQYRRSWAGVALNAFRLSTSATYFANVINGTTSSRTSAATLYIDVLFAPSYLFEGETPIFKKQEFSVDFGSEGIKVSSESCIKITALNGQLHYSVPEGYTPFSVTQAYANTANFSVVSVNPAIEDSSDTFIAVRNTSSSDAALKTLAVEVVFVREDMRNQLQHFMVNNTASGVTYTSEVDDTTPMFPGTSWSMTFHHPDEQDPGDLDIANYQCGVEVSNSGSSGFETTYGSFPYTTDIIMRPSFTVIRPFITGYLFKIEQFKLPDGTYIGTNVNTRKIGGTTVTQTLPGISAAVQCNYDGYRYTFQFSGLTKVNTPDGFYVSYTNSNHTQTSFTMPQGDVVLKCYFALRSKTKI